MPQQTSTFFVRFSTRANGNIHALDVIDLIVIDFRKDQLLLDSDRVIAPTIEGLGRKPFKVPHPGQSKRHEPFKKFIHPSAPHGHTHSDSNAFSELEIGDGFFRPGHNRFLPGDYSQLLYSGFDQLGVLQSFAQAHVDHDFLQPWNLHDIHKPKIFLDQSFILFFISSFQI